MRLVLLLRHALLLCALIVTSGLHAEVVVIVHGSSAVAALSDREVERIFMGKHRRFPSGEEAIPIDSPKGDTRDQFYLHFTGRNRARISAYWAQRLFTGRGTPPLQFTSTQAVIEFVAQTPRAIGYIDAKDFNSRVKVVARFP